VFVSNAFSKQLFYAKFGTALPLSYCLWRTCEWETFSRWSILS